MARGGPQSHRVESVAPGPSCTLTDSDMRKQLIIPGEVLAVDGDTTWRAPVQPREVSESLLCTELNWRIGCVEEDVTIYADVETITNWNLDRRLDVEVAPGDLGTEI